MKRKEIVAAAAFAACGALLLPAVLREEDVARPEPGVAGADRPLSDSGTPRLAPGATSRARAADAVVELQCPVPEEDRALTTASRLPEPSSAAPAGAAARIGGGPDDLGQLMAAAREGAGRAFGARGGNGKGKGPPASTPPGAPGGSPGKGKGGKLDVQTSGDAQAGLVGTPLAQPLAVVVHDRRGTPQANLPVTFAVRAGGGTLSVASTATDAAGRAETILTLGPAPEQNVVAADVGGAVVVFQAQAQALPAASLELTSGDGQSGVAGAPLAQPLVVTVKDAQAQPVPGVMVGFAVSAGGGRVSDATVATDAQGRAATTLTLGPAGPQAVTASVANLAPVTFKATALAPAASALVVASGDKQSAVAGTKLPQPLVVRATDANGGPVAGVDVTFSLGAGGGALSARTVTTDAQGLAAAELTVGPVPGTNTVTATAGNATATFTAMGLAAPASALTLVSGDAQTGVAGSALVGPLTVQARDAQGNPVPGVAVTFAVTAGGGTLSAQSMPTDPDGYARTVLTLGAQAGPNQVTATAPGLTPVTFDATGTAGPFAALAVASGDKQSGQAGTNLAQPLAVLAADANGNAVAGVDVTFAVTAGGGSLSATTVKSDAQGLASVELTLGAAPASNAVTATAGNATVTFTASGLAAPAAAVALPAGDAQTGVAGTKLADPLVVTVTDAQGQPVQGFTVTFAVAAGGGSLSASDVATDAQGRASAELTLGATAGPNEVTATASGLTGSPVTFKSTGTAGPAAALAAAAGDQQTAPAGTKLANPLVVEVTDANQNPVSGVAVTFAVATGGGSLSATSVQTDAQGRAATELTLGAATGAQTVTASATGLTPVTFTATAQAVGAARLARTSGDAQRGRIQTTLPQPLVVTALDANDQPVSGVTVTFAVTAGQGTLSAASATTDGMGQAATMLTLGTQLGDVTVTATAAGAAPVAFTATATGLTYTDDVKPILEVMASPQCTVCHVAGGAAGFTPLTTYQQVRNGTSISGVPLVVAFSPASSVIVQKTQPGGTMAGYLTPAQAQTILDWVNTGALESQSAPMPPAQLSGAGDGQTGQVNQPLAAPFVVTVSDSAGTPLAGVAIDWAIAAGGGALSATSGTTDGQGQTSTVLTLGPDAQTTNTVTATVRSNPALTVTFSAKPAGAFDAGPLAGSTNPLDMAALGALQSRGISPAGLASDGAFLRRVTADLLGRLPTVAELEAFEADATPDKRAALVDRLLSSQEFVDHWGREVIAVWLEVDPTVSFDQNGQRITYRFDDTLVADLAAGKTLRELVTDLSTGAGEAGLAFHREHRGDRGTQRVDKLMQAFTGMSIQCGRCHSHPLTTVNDDPAWTQDQVYGLYAFHATSSAGATKIDRDGRRFGSPVEPAFVADGQTNPPAVSVRLADPLDARQRAFADLLTASRAFSRGTAHRIWTEVASPLLDPNEFLAANLNAVANPDFLAALQQVFEQQSGSLQGFLRQVLNSRVYQLGSAHTTTAADPYQGRYVLRRHHSEVLERGIHELADVGYQSDRVFRSVFGFPERESIESRRDIVGLEHGLMQLNSPSSINGLVRGSGSRIANLAAAVDGGTIKQTVPSTHLLSSSGAAGLDAEIYDTIDFSGAALRRVDPTIDFAYGSGSPDPSIGSDTFSVRWTGQVRADKAETYTFYARTDDGVRVWVDGQLIIDRFVDQAPTESSGSIALTAGLHTIRVDYYENGGGAVAELRWSSPSLGGTYTYADAARELVRAALGREPTPDELTAIQAARSGAASTREALEDLAVALGSSAEFVFR